MSSGLKKKKTRQKRKLLCWIVFLHVWCSPREQKAWGFHSLPEPGLKAERQRFNHRGVHLQITALPVCHMISPLYLKFELKLRERPAGPAAVMKSPEETWLFLVRTLCSLGCLSLCPRRDDNSVRLGPEGRCRRCGGAELRHLQAHPWLVGRYRIIKAPTPPSWFSVCHRRGPSIM